MFENFVGGSLPNPWLLARHQLYNSSLRCNLNKNEWDLTSDAIYTFMLLGSLRAALRLLFLFPLLGQVTFVRSQEYEICHKFIVVFGMVRLGGHVIARFLQSAFHERVHRRHAQHPLC